MTQKEKYESADRYRQIRMGLELTQGQFAELLGVHPITVSQRETGKVPVHKEAWLAARMVELETKYEMEFEGD